MPAFTLTVLKVAFLALLYFFVYRAIRSVAVDLRAGGRTRPPRRGEGAPPPRAGRPASKPRPPRSIVVTDERGSRLDSKRLEGSMQIGRSEACQLRLGDTYISQFHARIFSRNGSWYIEDLGSTNGTYLNRRRITAPTEVHAGDRVRIGKTLLELHR